MKNIPLGGTMQFQIRAEIFNVFNTVNYGNPNGAVRRRDVRPHQLRARHAAGAAGRKAHVLMPIHHRSAA